MYSMTPEEAKLYDFDRFIQEFNSSFQYSANLDNVEITSIDERTDPDIHCADITMTCQQAGKNRDLLLRVLLDQTSGYSYCFMMYLDADGDSDLKAEYTKEYQAIVDSLHITTPPELTSAEFREITGNDGFIVEESEDEDAQENWSAYQVDSKGNIILISYYLFDSEELAKSCYDESYKELQQNQSSGSFDGYLTCGTWRFISEGTFYENSAIGEGEYRVLGLLSGKTVYIVIATKDESALETLAKGLYDLGA